LSLGFRVEEKMKIFLLVTWITLFAAIGLLVYFSQDRFINLRSKKIKNDALGVVIFILLAFAVALIVAGIGLAGIILIVKYVN